MIIFHSHFSGSVEGVFDMESGPVNYVRGNAHTFFDKHQSQSYGPSTMRYRKILEICDMSGASSALPSGHDQGTKHLACFAPCSVRCPEAMRDMDGCDCNSRGHAFATGCDVAFFNPTIDDSYAGF
jgi:hypothetical protein